MPSLYFAILGFTSVLLGAFAIDKILPAHLKKYSFILSMTSITLILYYFTFASGFYVGQQLIYVLSAGILFQDIRASRGRQLLKFVMNRKLFFFGSLIWLLISNRAELSQWDEFSWGAFAKHINYYGAYWDSHSAILSQHLRYLPGLTLWEDFFLAKDFYFEGPLYFSLGLIFLAGLVAAWPRQPNLKNALATVVLFGSVTVWFSSGLTTIYVDAAMGILMGLILLAVDDAEKPIELAAALVICLFLALTKESGVILTLICLFMIFVRLIRQKDFGFQGYAVLGLGFLAVCFNQILWKKYLQTDPQVTAFDSGAVFQKIGADLHELTAQSKETLAMVGKALLTRPFPRAVFADSSFADYAGFIGSWLFWVPLFGSLLFKLKNKSEFLVTFVLGLIGYTLFLVLAYLYFFSDYERQILVSYERYLGVFFLAFALFCIRFIIDQQLWKNKKIAFVLLALILTYRPTPSIFIPISVRRDVGNFRKDLQPISGKIKASTPANSKIWFIWQNSTGLEAMMIRYEIAPRLMNPGSWSLGEPYFNGDIWTQDFSAEQFADTLKSYDYIAIGKLDEKFTGRYGRFFESAPKNGSLYQKTVNEKGEIKLVEIP
jgi:hypothetical protein